MKQEKSYSPFWKIGFWTLSLLLLLVGAFMTGRICQRPLEFSSGLSATASCETGGSILATGVFTSGAETIYYLDSQNGRLAAGVLSRSEPAFVKLYTRKIKQDLSSAAGQLKVPMPADPRFIMVTGDNDTKKIGGGEMNNIARSFLYVAEINTGIMLVYVLPSQGDRDLEISNGEILLWTFARMNPGLGN